MKSGNGQKTFNFAFKIPEAETAYAETILASHAEFMKKTHSLDADGTKIHLIDYHVAKAPELNDLLDPSKGTTGFILYALNEIYAEAEGISQHMEQAMKWDGIGDFVELLNKYGDVKFSGEVIHTL
jgi:hypothetical protein